jgi:hypothetical protein
MDMQKVLRGDSIPNKLLLSDYMQAILGRPMSASNMFAQYQEHSLSKLMTPAADRRPFSLKWIKHQEKS